MSAERPADRIAKLMRLATSGDTPETANARAKAREALAKLDVELLDTLAGQRQRLREDLRAESNRLLYERATKAETGELVTRAMLLLGHYERIDALLAAVLLARVDLGQALTDEDRQHLDGPSENFLDGFMRASRERRAAERTERRQQARAQRRQQAQKSSPPTKENTP